MGWLTSVVDGIKTIGSGAKWALDKAPIRPTINYAANTAFYVGEQVLALREAIPALITPKVLKIVEGAGHILVYDVMPIVALNYANNAAQGYFREGQEEEQTMLAPYGVFLSALTLVNYGVRAYTMRQGVELFVHTLVLDTEGAYALNAHKAKLPPAPSICTEEECNFKRQFKGTLREPLILAFNDVLVWVISKFPYLGKEAASVLAVFFYGEYITRMTTPERCERHKAMDSQSVLALGLTFTLSKALMYQLLEATTGLPPFLYGRTLEHLVLLLHINVASHMNLPLVKPVHDAIPLDPLVIYERGTRFAVDVVFAGLMKRIPIDFKPLPGAKPFIPLSSVLRFLTKVLKSDEEQVAVYEPGFFKRTTNAILPKSFKSPKNMVNDPVVKLYWPGIQKGIFRTIDIVEKSGKPVSILTTGPQPIKIVMTYTLPMALNWQFGLPVKLSEFLLSLSKKEDFWDFVTALKLWTGRNSVSFEVTLSQKTPSVALLGTRKIVELPPETQQSQTPLPPAQDLLPFKPPPIITQHQAPDLPKKMPPTADAQALIPAKKTSVVTAASLFPNRKRTSAMQPQVDADATSQLEQSSSL